MHLFGPINPPWPERGGGKIKRGADRHYPLMNVKDIISLPVGEIADDNAHMYLWVTNNFLEAGLECMKAWGFRYITMITWVKDRMGLGQYYRGMTEHCLFGVRGMVPYQVDENGKRQQGKTVFVAPRKEHSEKPKQMREMIEKVSPGPRIELFSRKNVYGWDHLGNEVDGKDIRDQLEALIGGKDVAVNGIHNPSPADTGLSIHKEDNEIVDLFEDN